MEYKCKVCGGELRFEPELGKLRCPFCGTEYEMDEYADHANLHDHDHDADQGRQAKDAGFAQATDDSTDIQEDLVVFSCPHCGAELVTDKDTIASKCVFCQTPMVIDQQASGKFKPQMVIPFEVDKKQIEDLYEQYIQTKPFYPPEYSKANVIEKIKGIYLPFWMFDLNLSGFVQAQGERTMTHTIGDWIVTDHFVYQIDRKGKQAFDRIPVIASSKTPKDAMDALEPFDYSKMVQYNPGYLPGFLAQRYDLDERKTFEVSNERAQVTYQQSMTDTMAGYEMLQITNEQIKPVLQGTNYTLCPVYLLFMDYDHDEDKLIAINGQTGKIVGNIPIDKKKRNRYFITRSLLACVVIEALIFAGFMLL